MKKRIELCDLILMFLLGAFAWFVACAIVGHGIAIFRHAAGL